MSRLTLEHHYSTAVGLKGEGRLIFLTPGSGACGKLFQFFTETLLQTNGVSNSFSLFNRGKQWKSGTVMHVLLFIRANICNAAVKGGGQWEKLQRPT